MSNIIKNEIRKMYDKEGREISYYSHRMSDIFGTHSEETVSETASYEEVGGLLISRRFIDESTEEDEKTTHKRKDIENIYDPVLRINRENIYILNHGVDRVLDSSTYTEYYDNGAVKKEIHQTAGRKKVSISDVNEDKSFNVTSRIYDGDMRLEHTLTTYDKNGSLLSKYDFLTSEMLRIVTTDINGGKCVHTFNTDGSESVEYYNENNVFVSLYTTSEDDSRVLEKVESYEFDDSGRPIKYENRTTGDCVEKRYYPDGSIVTTSKFWDCNHDDFKYSEIYEDFDDGKLTSRISRVFLDEEYMYHISNTIEKIEYENVVEDGIEYILERNTVRHSTDLGRFVEKMVYVNKRSVDNLIHISTVDTKKYKDFTKTLVSTSHNYIKTVYLENTEGKEPKILSSVSEVIY